MQADGYSYDQPGAVSTVNIDKKTSYDSNAPPPPYSKEQSYATTDGAAYPSNVDTVQQQQQQTTTVIITDDNPIVYLPSSFSDKYIRQGFIRKVYLILMAQLSVTVGFICLFMFCQPIKKFVQTNIAVYFVSYAVFLVSYFVLVCCPRVRKQVPGNYICLLIFTLALSYMTATISCFHDTAIVLICVGICAAICLSVSIFAVQTKYDFTTCFSILFVLILVLVYCGFACLILYLVGYYYYMNVLWAGIAAFIISIFLVIDTQLVVGGKNRTFAYSPEEYITAALQLYLDIVTLLIILLGFSGNSS